MWQRLGVLVKWKTNTPSYHLLSRTKYMGVKLSNVLKTVHNNKCYLCFVLSAFDANSKL